MVGSVASAGLLRYLTTLKKTFWTSVIGHGFVFCHSSGLFTDDPFFFLAGSSSVCYKPTSPVQVLEDTGFLYQDHQLFAGRHEVSPLAAEAISAKEKAGKWVAMLPYEPTAFTYRFFLKHKLNGLDHLQIIVTDLKASFSSSVESKGSYLWLECYNPPSFVTCACGGCNVSACPSGHGCSSLHSWTKVHSFLLMEQDRRYPVEGTLWLILLDLNIRQLKYIS